MGSIPLPPPPLGIPYFLHMLAHGRDPRGESRCVGCGATTDFLTCPYCSRKKPIPSASR